MHPQIRAVRKHRVLLINEKSAPRPNRPDYGICDRKSAPKRWRDRAMRSRPHPDRGVACGAGARPAKHGGDGVTVARRHREISFAPELSTHEKHNETYRRIRSTTPAVFVLSVFFVCEIKPRTSGSASSVWLRVSAPLREAAQQQPKHRTLWNGKENSKPDFALVLPFPSRFSMMIL